jgi:type IV pilus biogenesis/stability protein PilW
MSLIMDALKKAQQLRMKESKEAPVFTRPDSKKEKMQKVRKYLWVFVITGLSSFFLLFFLWSSVLHFSPSEERREVVPIEKKETPVNIVTKNEFEESQKGEIPSLQREKLLSSMEQFTEEKTKRPAPKKQEGGQKEMARVKTPEKRVIERELAAPTLDSQKELTLSSRANDLEHNILTYFNLGVDLYRQREVAKAIQAYQKVIELDPTYVEAYNNLGIIYQDIGDFDKALEAYQKAIEVNPKYEKAYNNLGILYFLNNRYEESAEAFQKALEINPGNIESYINLGILFKKQGEFKKAIECFQKALSINPFNGETYYNIGMLYEQLEDYNLAIGNYQKFIQLSSKTHPDLVSKVQRHVEYLMTTKGGKEK